MDLFNYKDIAIRMLLNNRIDYPNQNMVIIMRDGKKPFTVGGVIYNTKLDNGVYRYDNKNSKVILVADSIILDPLKNTVINAVEKGVINETDIERDCELGSGSVKLNKNITIDSMNLAIAIVKGGTAGGNMGTPYRYVHKIEYGFPACYKQSDMDFPEHLDTEEKREEIQKFIYKASRNELIAIKYFLEQQIRR